MIDKKTSKVMFLCTANSCRSQMAEGLARHFAKEILDAYSAGLLAFHVNPRAIAVLREIDIDISDQTSKDIDITLLSSMDLIITLCDNADKTCPSTPPEIKRLHWPIRDPIRAKGTEEEIMKDFRRARDEIKEKILYLIDKLKAGELESLQ